MHKVVDWTIKEHFQGLPTDVPLPDEFDPSGDESGFRELEDEDELARWFAELPEGERRVCEPVTCVGWSRTRSPTSSG